MSARNLVGALRRYGLIAPCAVIFMVPAYGQENQRCVHGDSELLFAPGTQFDCERFRVCLRDKQYVGHDKTFYCVDWVNSHDASGAPRPKSKRTPG